MAFRFVRSNIKVLSSDKIKFGFNGGVSKFMLPCGSVKFTFLLKAKGFSNINRGCCP